MNFDISKGTRIGLSCLFGGIFAYICLPLITSMIQLSGVFLVPIGMVLGGLSSWFSYDFEKVKEVVRNEWNKIFYPDENKKKIRAYKRLGYIYTAMFISGPLVSAYLIIFLIICYSLISANVSILTMDSISIKVPLFTFFIITSFFLIFLPIFLIPDVGNDYQSRRLIISMKNMAKKFNGWTAIKWPMFNLPVIILKTLWNLIKLTKEIPSFISKTKKFAVQNLKKFGKFLVNVFVKIHSSERLLCLIDGAITGGLVALLSYNPYLPVLGMVVGFFLGKINYQVVSLKIIPKYIPGFVPKK